MFRAYFEAEKKEPEVMHFAFQEKVLQKIEFSGEKKEPMKFKISRSMDLELGE